MLSALSLALGALCSAPALWKVLEVLVSSLPCALPVLSVPGAAGAVIKFVFLGGREETTAYLCLKTYFVVSLVIYRMLTFSSLLLSPLLHSQSISPFFPSLLTDQSPQRTLGVCEGPCFNICGFEMILLTLTGSPG